MSSSGPKSLPSIGFLTVKEHTEHGACGGYLVLNAAGRPLEFHCTAPLKPNRAQEILYGPTLKPFLYGEQIGQTLVNKAKASPLMICTDTADVLALRGCIAAPVVLVLPGEEETSPRGENRLEVDSDRQYAAGVNASTQRGLAPFALGRSRLALEKEHAADQQLVREGFAPYAEHFDLLEPFVRIREALDEAQGYSRAA